MSGGEKGGGMWMLVTLVVWLVPRCWGDLLDLGPYNQADLENDILSRYPGQDDYISPTRRVWAALGGTGNLPCNLTSQPVKLVLWYKDGIVKPIYSLDMRRVPVSHWKSPTHLGSRASFHPGSSTLTLQRVQVEDGGTYRCRVDFRNKPTLTFITNLTVIVPPRRLAVYTELGLEARSIVGPFTEGDVLRLTCRASGGSPPPVVTWWEGPSLLDVTSEVERSDEVTNTLVVPSLTRRDLHRTLTCQAANSNLTAPLVTTVTLDMNFPPLEVRLLSSNEALSAGKQYSVACQAAGARPPAVIAWTLGPKRLSSHTDKTSHEGNVTRSELLLSPEASDAGKVLTCHAESPALPTRPFIDQWKLDVYYVPEATLRPGRSLNLSNIEEGDDVYFECSIKANPRVYKIVWKHEGTELQHNVSGGIIISNQSLVLQSVARTATGHYQCVASNIEGDGSSNTVHLRVKYAPVCRNSLMTYHGAARHEQVNIPCHLDAHPKPLAYRWTFNNSGESVEIPQEHIEVGPSESTVSYTPNTELDYGTLLCWGINAVGRQRHPCVFHVFPAGRPDPVHNCSVYNLSEAVVNVRCAAGFDGGLPQTFILELYEPRKEFLLANTTNSVPTFSVPGVAAGVALKGVVYSTNGKGASEKVSLQVYTLKDVAERRTAAVKPSPTQGHSQGRLGVRPILALALGAAGGLLLVVVLVCAVVRLQVGRRRRDGGGGGAEDRRRAAAKDAPGGQEATGGGGLSCGSVAVGVPQAPKAPPAGLQEDPPEEDAPPRDFDERNPDVIPQSGPESWLVEGVNTISSASLPATYGALSRPRPLYTRTDYQRGTCGSKRLGRPSPSPSPSPSPRRPGPSVPQPRQEGGTQPRRPPAPWTPTPVPSGRRPSCRGRRPPEDAAVPLVDGQKESSV